jgi:hypothetical protein
MIKFDKNNIVVAEDFITPNKIDGFIVYFSTPEKGKIGSWLQAVWVNPPKPEEGIMEESYTFVGIAPMERKYSDTEFAGKDILRELHNIYIAELSALNPTITFNSTLPSV